MNETGNIAYNTLIETNPDAYADELLKTYGQRVAITVMSSFTIFLDKKISSLEKQLKSEIDSNSVVKIETEIAKLKIKSSAVAHQIARINQTEIKRVKTMDIVENNPFRILGVYSNASTKEITANVSKIKAYLKVGKRVEFPSDLNNLLKPVVRTIENVDKALSQLNLPQEKIKYALFWFIKVTSMDEVALNHLNEGDVYKCQAIFAKRRTNSALLNKGLLALFDEDYDSFVSYYTEVLHSEKLADLIMLVCGDTIKISEEELSHCFIDLLLEESADVDWMKLFLDNGSSNDDDDYLTEKIVSEPIKLIDKEISKAKLANGAENRYKAGIALINNTKDSLATLSDIIDVEDVKYQMIADRLAREILQCGIDY